MDKKGDVAEKSIYYLISGAVLTVIFFVLVYFISSYISISQQTPPGLEYKIFSERFVSSPYCFVYQDADTGRSYPGLVDWGKFSNYSLNYCYESFSSAGDKKSPLELVSAPSDATSVRSRQTVVYENLGFRLSLSLIDPAVKKTIQTSSWNGKVKKGFFRDVLVNYDGEIRSGKLFVEVSG